MGYAICKEGYPENPKKKVALVGPDRKEEVRHEKLDFDKKKLDFFITLTLEDFQTPRFSAVYMTRVRRSSLDGSKRLEICS